MPQARLTPEQRKARIRAALARADEKPGAVESAVKYKPEPVQEQQHPVTQEREVAEPTTPAPAKPEPTKEPQSAPITEQTIARGVQRRGGMNKEPNYQLHVLMALTVAFIVQGLATSWGTVKASFKKTTGG